MVDGAFVQNSPTLPNFLYNNLILKKFYRKLVQKSGYEKGIEKGKEEIAKKMKDKGTDIDTIVEITGLNKEQIECL